MNLGKNSSELPPTLNPEVDTLLDISDTEINEIKEEV
jgi:hypothetical protein